MEYRTNLTRCRTKSNNDLDPIAVRDIAPLLGGVGETALTKLMGRPRVGAELEILGGCKRSEIENHPLPSVDLYWSLNDFWKPARKGKGDGLTWLRGATKYLNSLNALWVDLDYYRSEWRDKSPCEIQTAILEALGPEMHPNIFAWSGRGAYAIWLIEPIEHQAVGKESFWMQVQRWRTISHQLTNRLAAWGSDISASISPCGVLRVPGSINSKSGQAVTYDILSPEKRSLSEIEQACRTWGGFDRAVGRTLRQGVGIRVAKEIPKGLKRGSVTGLIQARFNDLNAILEDRKKRNYNWEGIRNKFCFHWAQAKLQCYSHGIAAAAVDELLAINDSFASPASAPATEWEIRCITRTRAYTLTNSRVIEDLDITEEEMRRLELQTLISRKVKLERRRAARGSGLDGRKERSRERNESVFQAIEGGCTTIAAVSAACGLARATVYRAVGVLVESGGVVSVSGRLAVGGGGGVAGGSSAPSVPEVQAKGLEAPEDGSTSSDKTSRAAGSKVPKKKRGESGETGRGVETILRAAIGEPTFLAMGEDLTEGGWRIEGGGAQLLGGVEAEAIRTMAKDPQFTFVGLNLRSWFRKLLPLSEVAAKLMDLRIAASLVDGRAAQWGWRRMAIHFLTEPGEREEIASIELAKLFQQTMVEQGLQQAYQDEIELARTLDRIERRGIEVDCERLRCTRDSISKRLAGIHRRIEAQAGERLDPSDSRRVGEILFSQRGLPVLRRTSRNIPSTDSAILEELSIIDPLAGSIAEARRLQSAISGCIDPILQAMDFQANVHPEFQQGASINGRVSARNPNLQGVVGAGEIGASVRSCFRARAGKSLIGFDLSQIEIRALAHLTGDTELIRIFWECGDVYTLTASRVLSIEEGRVNAEERAMAKEALIACIYGMGSRGLASKLRCSEAQARDFVASFQRAFPGFQVWKDRVLGEARECGFVMLPNGVRRYVDGLLSADWKIRFEAERKAINALVQGTAAIWFKRLVLALSTDDNSFAIVNLVHDEVLAEVDSGSEEQAIERIHQALPLVAQSIKVPLVAKIGCGQTWREVHRWRCRQW